MSDDDSQLIDLLTDELALARAQIDGGLPALAEATTRQRLARLEADGGGEDEADALRLLLAEALWRQGRTVAARTALDGMRPGGAQRRLPIAVLIEAETLAAAGESDRAAGAQERLLASIGPDDAFRLRAGVSGRLAWPLPEELRAEASRPPRPPWAPRAPSGDGGDGSQPPVDDERVAAARGRLERARVAYVAAELDVGDREMSIALRLDPGLAADGVTILEPTLGGQPAGERLLLYGDLLRAAGREIEADRAYDRAASRRSEPTATGDPAS
jgi:hypothetical protein